MKDPADSCDRGGVRAREAGPRDVDDTDLEEDPRILRIKGRMTSLRRAHAQAQRGFQHGSAGWVRHPPPGTRRSEMASWDRSGRRGSRRMHRQKMPLWIRPSWTFGRWPVTWLKGPSPGTSRTIKSVLVYSCLVALVAGGGSRSAIPADIQPTTTVVGTSSPPNPVVPPGCRRVLHTITAGRPLVVDIYTIDPYARVATSVDGGPFRPAGWESRC